MRMHVLENYNYVSLDNLNARNLALPDFELFLEIYGAPLIIDKFQYATNLLSYIKIKVDEASLQNLFSDSKEVIAMYYLIGS